MITMRRTSPRLIEARGAISLVARHSSGGFATAGLVSKLEITLRALEKEKGRYLSGHPNCNYLFFNEENLVEAAGIEPGAVPIKAICYRAMLPGC